MEFKKLPVSKLTMNTGQIEGVPANPRQWTQADLDRLAASIEETPELLDARGAIVVPHKGEIRGAGRVFNPHRQGVRQGNLGKQPLGVCL